MKVAKRYSNYSQRYGQAAVDAIGSVEGKRQFAIRRCWSEIAIVGLVTAQ